jgi:hypothetical protein
MTADSEHQVAYLERTRFEVLDVWCAEIGYAQDREVGTRVTSCKLGGVSLSTSQRDGDVLVLA